MRFSPLYAEFAFHIAGYFTKSSMFSRPRMKERAQHNWTHEDIDLLLHAVEQQGRQWKAIQQRFFPQISRQGIRNMYYKHIRENGSSSNTSMEEGFDQRLVDQITDFLTSVGVINARITE